MKTFEEFKSEVQKMVDTYNGKGHRLEDGVLVTYRPVFEDRSGDGHMPHYFACFQVLYDGRPFAKTGTYVKYAINYSTPWQSGVRANRYWRKTLRGVFYKIFNR